MTMRISSHPHQNTWSLQSNILAVQSALQNISVQYKIDFENTPGATIYRNQNRENCDDDKENLNAYKTIIF